MHAGDRHVAAAAVHAGATHVVTWNVRHFPAKALAPHGIQAFDPDSFLSMLISDDAETVRLILERHRLGLHRPPFTKAEYIEAFRGERLIRAAELLR